MFYARPSIDRTNGRIAVGLPPHHVLNRLTSKNQRKAKPEAKPCDLTNDARHILKYLFPRQYDLHSIFISESSYSVRDYTNREDEIEAVRNSVRGGPRKGSKVWYPLHKT
ncbi:hypothetical protein AURDEDRAFT_122438 [Auricularia subglabra TFB-10046 SS5]|nr:hypothetical protein AURDEDRAFT_122438 [Auricularia subglabra TFB-10046 SS5]